MNDVLPLGYCAARLLGFRVALPLGYCVVPFLGYCVERRLVLRDHTGDFRSRDSGYLPLWQSWHNRDTHIS
jgi:hypothetical protein